MPESLGARLRMRREERGIDLIAIAEATKIKTALLEGLERDEVADWPSGIFRRAYVRAYAQMIGLDPDAVVQEFLIAHPDPGDAFAATTAAAAAAQEEAAAKGGGASVRLRTLVDSALGSFSRLRQPPAELEPSVAGAASSDAPPPAATSRPATPEDPPATDASENAPERTHPESPTIVADDRPESVPPSLEAVAHLCTELGRVAEGAEIPRLLDETADALQATGLIVWLWDPRADGLRPVLVQGYSERVLAQLPVVRRDEDNATALAFRTATTRDVAPRPGRSGALVVPLLTPEGCAGVLAIELRSGIEPAGPLRALATLIAAALTQLVGRAGAAGRVRLTPHTAGRLP